MKRLAIFIYTGLPGAVSTVDEMAPPMPKQPSVSLEIAALGFQRIAVAREIFSGLGLTNAAQNMILQCNKGETIC
jgi:hypothetical protein